MTEFWNPKVTQSVSLFIYKSSVSCSSDYLWSSKGPLTLEDPWTSRWTQVNCALIHLHSATIWLNLLAHLSCSACPPTASSCEWMDVAGRRSFTLANGSSGRKNISKANWWKPLAESLNIDAPYIRLPNEAVANELHLPTIGRHKGT